MATDLKKARSVDQWRKLARSSSSAATMLRIGRMAMEVKIPDPSSVLSALASNPNMTDSLGNKINRHSNHAFKFLEQYWLRGSQKSSTHTVRKLEAQDLGRGFFETLQNLSQTGNFTTQRAQEVLSEIQKNPHHNILVAVDEKGEIVGATTLLIEPKFIHLGGLVGHIEDVAVRKGHEGKGIGKSLVNAAVSLAKEVGCYKCILDCSKDNVKFYARAAAFKVHEVGMRKDLPLMPAVNDKV